MTSLFEKIRVSGLALAHSLMDKAIDLNDVNVLRQYVRDMETSITQLEDESNGVSAEYIIAERNSRKLAGDVKELDSQINAILTDDDLTNDHLATTLQISLDRKNALLEAAEEEMELGHKTLQSYREVLSAMRAKRESMLSQLHNVESMKRRAAAQERASATMEAAHRVTSSGPDASVDSIAHNVEKEMVQAGLRFNSAAQKLSSTIDSDPALASAKAKIAERKAKLAAQKSS
jgi:hypothetical protein